MLHLFYTKSTSFTDIHLTSIRTAHTNGKFEKIIVHEDSPGNSSYYQEIRKLPYVELRRIEYPTQINNCPIGPKISMELVRLKTIVEEGGVIGDMDFLYLRSFKPLLEMDAFISLQGKQKKKLSNLMMYSKHPNHPYFVSYLFRYMGAITPNVKIMSQKIPYEVSTTMPIRILSEKVFFPIVWSNTGFLHGETIDISQSYAVYLWRHLRNHISLQDLQKTAIKDFLPTPRPPVTILQSAIVYFN